MIQNNSKTPNKTTIIEGTKDLLQELDFKYDQRIIDTLAEIRFQYNVDQDKFEEFLRYLEYRDKKQFDQNEITTWMQQLDNERSKDSKQKTPIVFKNQKQKQQQNSILKPTIKDSALISKMDINFLQRTDKQKPKYVHNPYNIPINPDFKIQNYMGQQDWSLDEDFEQLLKIENYQNYLYVTLKQQQNTLYEKLEIYKRLYKTYLESVLNFSEIKFHNFIENTSESFFAVGRIVSEQEGKINNESIVLEVSPQKKFKLSLQKIQNYIIFPNQYIALEGTLDEDRGLIIADQLFINTLEDTNSENNINKQINTTKILNQSDKKSIVVAHGPYSLVDSISYTPLDAFLKEVKNIKPDFLILFGPFLDQENEHIASGEIYINKQYLNYHGLFCNLINTIIKEIDSENTKIVIVPSPNDQMSTYPMPQTRYKIESNLFQQFQNQNVIFLSNPCKIELFDDVKVQGISSNIILEMLTKSIFKGTYSNNRIRSIAEQILNQRNILPLYPIVKNAIDLTNLQRIKIWEDQSDIPHIIIIPSILNYFVEQFNDTIFLNQEILCRGEQGGSYAIINIFTNNSLSVAQKTQIEIKYL